MSAEDHFTDERGDAFLSRKDLEGLENIELGPRARARTKPVLQALERLREAIELDNRWPDEVFRDGAVIKFERVYRERVTSSGRVSPAGRYTYVAVRTGELWYTTGQMRRTMTDDQMVEFVGTAKASLVTSWSEF